MKTHVACDNCGEVIARQGLASHRRGEPCRVQGARRTFEARGLVPVGAGYAAWLQPHGIACEIGPRAYHPGSRGSRGHTSEAAYVEPPVAAIVTSTRIVGSRRRAALAAWARLSEAERVALVAAVVLHPADPEAQARLIIHTLEEFSDASDSTDRA